MQQSQCFGETHNGQFFQHVGGSDAENIGIVSYLMYGNALCDSHGLGGMGFRGGHLK